jgi:hypothetical protein
MMGHHARSGALFYYFRLEDQIPESHLLRLIDKHISFEFVRQQSYACIWRGAGSPGWASIRRFRTTPRSARTGTDGFSDRSCSSSCLSRSCGSVWKWGWCKVSICRSMAVSSRPMRRRRPYSTRSVGGSGTGPSHCASVSAGSGRTESGQRSDTWNRSYDCAARCSAPDHLCRLSFPCCSAVAPTRIYDCPSFCTSSL